MFWGFSSHLNSSGLRIWWDQVFLDDSGSLMFSKADGQSLLRELNTFWFHIQINQIWIEPRNVSRSGRAGDQQSLLMYRESESGSGSSSNEGILHCDSSRICQHLPHLPFSCPWQLIPFPCSAWVPKFPLVLLRQAVGKMSNNKKTSSLSLLEYQKWSEASGHWNYRPVLVLTSSQRLCPSLFLLC